MLTPFFLFFGLTVATAVIAYWSDNLGKKLGKKRISLLGLRPRDTATVLTIASSWGIMAFTLVVMLIVAKPLRDAIFRYDRLKSQNETIQLQSDQLKAQNGQIERELTNRENLLAQVEKRADQAGKNVVIQTKNARYAQNAAEKALEQQRLATLREASARKSEAVAKRGASQATKRAAVALKGEKAATLQAQLASANLGKVQVQLSENNDKLTQTRGELGETNKDLSAANKKLNTALEKYESATKDLERIKETARLAGRYAKSAIYSAAEASRQEAVAKRELDSAQKQVDALKQQQTDLQKEITELNNTRVQLSAVVNQLSTRPVLVAVNQTLVARTLPPGLTAARVESHLRSLLALANKEVGPKLLPNSKVVLLQYIQAPDGRLIQLPTEQVFAGAADFIAASGAAVSVRLVSHSNFAEGEPEIQVRFEVVEVKTAAKSGDVLAETTIDSKIGDAGIFNALLGLVESGRREAMRKGINPPQTPDEPNFYENGTNEQIFVALRQIERGGKIATVKIVAADDLSTVEPVRVRFDVS